MRPYLAWRRRRTRRGAGVVGILVALVAAQALTAEARGAGPVATDHNRHGTFLVKGKKAFPIGVSTPPPLAGLTPQGTLGLDALVAGGITFFTAGPHGTPWTVEVLDETRAWADAAGARGVYTWVNLRELAESLEGTPERDLLVEVVTALRGSPGLGMWKGLDEASARVPPERVLESYELVKELDPGRLFHTIHPPLSTDGTVFQHPPDPPDLTLWNAVSDTHGINVYPVYHHLVGVRQPKLGFVGLWTAAIRNATQTLAVTTTLQICFAGSDDRNGSGDFVLPTARQERFMIYDAILSGARGLFFYGGHLGKCHRERDQELGWNWAFWQRTLARLVGEIRAGKPLHKVLVRPETSRRLRTSNTYTRAVRRLAPGELWVIAAHRRGTKATVTVRGLPSWARLGRTYPGGKTVRATSGRIRLSFPAWGVRVVRFVR
jgi:hypothetical protein